MAFHVKDEATDKAVRRLAALKQATLTDTIREAVENEYARLRQQVSPEELVRPLQDAIRAMRKPGRGLPADKAFYDEMWGDP
jgi:antitoxin VapB